MKSRCPRLPASRFRRALLPGPGRILSALLAALWAAGAAILWTSCMSDGPSTETGNPSIEGTLRDGQGLPAAGTVKLFRVAVKAPTDSADLSALVAPTLIQTLQVGPDGAYRFVSLPAARYAVEGVDAAGRNFGWVPGLQISAAGTLNRIVTLSPPARLLGRVTRGPNALPAGVADQSGILVRVGGADRFAFSDTAGYFALENVPAGVYRIAFAAPDGHYEPKFLDNVGAGSGDTLELPWVELDWSRFQAPPAPAGLAVRADSAAGTFSLSWRAVKLANLDHYEVSRRDSLDPRIDTVWLVTDTAFTDSAGGLAPGHRLEYRVTTVNSLGNRSPEASVIVPVPPGPGGPGTGEPGVLAGVALSGSVLLEGVRIRLYPLPVPLPPGPGSPGALPALLAVLDSAVTGPDGRYLFAELDSGAYTVTATDAGGMVAIRIGLLTRSDASRIDTLRVLLGGTLQGSAARSVNTAEAKMENAGIYAFLAGTPYLAVTGYGTPGSPFTLRGIAPGAYRLVVHAPPEGIFLPDTLSVSVAAGENVRLPDLIRARYNPEAPPPRIRTLWISTGSRALVSLAWQNVDGYEYLQGYRVLRLDADENEIRRSGVLAAASYADDISGLPRGTVLRYAVIVVGTNGRESERGGSERGLPVEFTVP